VLAYEYDAGIDGCAPSFSSSVAVVRKVARAPAAAAKQTDGEDQEARS